MAFLLCTTSCERANVRWVSLTQIEYFVAVAEEQNLTRAAIRLHVSQPPLTRHIRSLEAELGVPLFARTAKGMALLPAGEVFLQHARQIIGCVDQARLAVAAQAGALANEPATGSCSGPPQHRREGIRSLER